MRRRGFGAFDRRSRGRDVRADKRTARGRVAVTAMKEARAGSDADRPGRAIDGGGADRTAACVESEFCQAARRSAAYRTPDSLASPAAEYPYREVAGSTNGPGEAMPNGIDTVPGCVGT